MKKAVIDTSVFVAALLSRDRFSSPSLILQLWKENKFKLVMAPALLEELVATLLAIPVNEDTILQLIKDIASIGLYIPGIYESVKLDAIDKSDNKFLAAAYESNADYIVSLDKHILNLKHFHKIAILTPRQFVREIF